MARQASTTVENNFVKGLITEFTAMNFPENAILEGDNCVYSELGGVTRRLGMDFENEFLGNTISGFLKESDAVIEFEWYSVGNEGTTKFLVQQLGFRLHFFSVENSGLSSKKKSFTVNLSTYAAPGKTATNIRSKPAQFTSGKGYLFVVHQDCDPIYVEYNNETDSISVNVVELKVRDFEGLPESQEIDFRPTTLTNTHKYNLYNQGWYITARTSGNPVAEGGNDKQVLQFWEDSRSDYPSNADIWWIYKNGFDVMINDNFNKFTLGNTPAPKGHYLYDAFNIDRTGATGIPGLPSVTTTSRPSSVCFYAGRVFYSGVADDGFSDKVYFTQILESDDQLGKAYQVNDPTSETIFDLLDTDGGVISLPLIEKVVSMKVIADALIVIGTNAIFCVRGTENGPFKATDYSVEYVGAIGGTSHTSIIEVDSKLMWFNNDALYALLKDQIGVYFQIQNVSKSTIQSLIDSIPEANKQFIKGDYNKKEQIIQWLFSDQDVLTGYQYNRILEFNIVSQAFYTHTIDISLGPVISGIITIGGQKIETISLPVTDNSLENVTDNLLDLVTVESSTFVPNSEIFKYTTVYDTNKVTYSELRDDDLLDWVSYNPAGASYESYGVSGYRVRGEFLRKFNSTPCLFVVRNLDGGRCEISGIWDYGFRESIPIELYLTRPEVSYLMRRIKLRGKGRSLQIKFRSVGNAPFDLIGWSTFDTGGALP